MRQRELCAYNIVSLPYFNIHVFKHMLRDPPPPLPHASGFHRMHIIPTSWNVKDGSRLERILNKNNHEPTPRSSVQISRSARAGGF